MIDQDIATAVGHESLSDDDRDQPADCDHLGLATRTNDDGWPEVRYRGEWHEVPCFGDIEDWIFDVSYCTTPDGRTVEADHPESWLTLLGLV